MSTMPRLLRIGQIAVFVLCIGIPAAMFGFGERGEPVDNRRPTPRPPIRVFDLFDTERTAEFDTYFDEGFPLRDEAIELNARADRAVGDSSNPDVVVGRTGWLFLRESIEQPCRTAAEMAELTDVLDRAERIVSSTGRELTNVIAPDKASVYPDRLADPPSCVLANAALFDDLATEATIVMAWPATAATAQADERAYLRLDTHWTAAGAVPTARAMVDLVAPGRWDDDAIVTDPPIADVGDLSILLGLPQTEQEVRARAHPGPAPAIAVARPYTDRDGTVVEWIGVTRYESGWDGAVAGRTLLLHDSFGDRVVDLAADYFADITAIGDPSPRRSQHAIVDAQRIIRLEVQRRFFPSVVTADLAAEFAVALQDELAPATIDGDCATGCAVAADGADDADDADTYLIATLAPGAAAGSIEFGGRRFELDALTPAAAWLVTAGDTVTLRGDAVDRVAVRAVSVG
ncbi:MAG: hypothetical protein HKN44_12900 [Ilumatobacter sp.]|nr:hypothetical protein [Ilumatobacter sp.]